MWGINPIKSLFTDKSFISLLQSQWTSQVEGSCRTIMKQNGEKIWTGGVGIHYSDHQGLGIYNELISLWDEAHNTGSPIKPNPWNKQRCAQFPSLSWPVPISMPSCSDPILWPSVGFILRLINWFRQCHYLPYMTPSRRPLIILSSKLFLITNQKHHFQLSFFISIFIVRMAKYRFLGRVVLRSYFGGFMGLV